MSPRNCRVKARLLQVIAALIVAGAPRIALAHPVVITPGTLRATEENLEIRITLTEHDLLHEGLDSADALAVDGLARRITESVIAYDDAGAIVPQSPVRVDRDENSVDWTATAMWKMVADARFVTLRMTPATELTVPNRQLVLAVFTMEEATPAAVLRLGGGDVVEVIDLKALRMTAGKSQWPARRPVADFRRMRIVLNIEERTATADVVIPVPLLSPRPVSPERGHSSMTDRDVQPEISRIIDLSAKHLAVEFDGRLVDLQWDAPRLLGPGDSPDLAARDRSGQAACFWSARLGVRAKVRTECPIDRAALRWSGFNASMLGADAEIQLAGAKVTQRTLTEVANKLEWRRDPTPMDGH